jgi:hypothetical protein
MERLTMEATRKTAEWIPANFKMACDVDFARVPWAAQMAARQIRGEPVALSEASWRTGLVWLCERGLAKEAR